MKEEHLIACWSTPNIDLYLLPDNEAKMISQEVTLSGSWALNDKTITLALDKKRLDEKVSIFLFGSSKGLKHRKNLRIEKLTDTELLLEDEDNRSNLIQFRLNNKETEIIYNKKKLKENRKELKEKVLEAWVIAIMIGSFAGGIIRLIVGPGVPAWIIAGIVFIGCLVFIIKN